jgi:AcrR family transcriptional regulator
VPEAEAGSESKGLERGSSVGLAPTARGILDAAKRLLIEKGYDGIRFDAIAAESGSNKSMIRYYFGSKAGLIAALFDDMTHDVAIELLGEVIQETDQALRVRQHLMALYRLVDPPSEYFKRYFDILPHAIRNDELRTRMAELFRWHREVEAKCFGGAGASSDDPDLVALGSVVMAAIDGLCIQASLEDPGFDQTRTWRVFGEMVDCYLERGGACAGHGEGRRVPA